MTNQTTTGVVDADTLRRYKKEFNFFETPGDVADRMADLVDTMAEGSRVLEPSAGLGSLMRAVRRCCRVAPASIDFCEIQPEFVRILTEAGDNHVGGDFTEYNPGPVYDVVIMNPPYRNRAAERHTDHAWDCLKPGGRLVTLVSKTAAEWIDEEFMGHVFDRQELPRGTFRETSIETVLYLIQKPLY